MSLILSKIILLRKILIKKSVSGLSLKTNVIYLMVYLMRFIHVLSWPKHSYKVIYYNTLKTSFVLTQVILVYFIGKRFRRSYYFIRDTFPITILMVISFIAGFILEENAFFRFSFESFCYKTSLILESIAILPQLVMIQESGECEILHFNYIAFLGMYRLLYLIYFICYLSCYYYVPRIILITSIIQTLLYADFFYILFKYILSDKDRGINLEKDSDNINGNSNILKDIFSYSFIKRKTRLNI